MIDVILGLALALPAQAPVPAAPRQDVLKAEHQAVLRATAIRRRDAAEARAAAARRARAERMALHMAQLEYQARVAPYVAEQQSRQAQLAGPGPVRAGLVTARAATESHLRLWLWRPRHRRSGGRAGLRWLLPWVRPPVTQARISLEAAAGTSTCRATNRQTGARTRAPSTGPMLGPHGAAPSARPWVAAALLDAPVDA